MPAAEHAAAVLLCWRGLGGPPPKFGVLLVPLAEFPSSPHCRLPGNTTCQQNAVGLMKLPPLRILQSQAEGIILEGDWPPVPIVGGRAVILRLKCWKTAGYSSQCGSAARQSCEILVCYSPVGICVAVGRGASSIHGSGSFYCSEGTLGLCSSSMCPLSWTCQHCGEQQQQDGRAESPGDEGAVTARKTSGTGSLLTL